MFRLFQFLVYIIAFPFMLYRPSRRHHCGRRHELRLDHYNSGNIGRRVIKLHKQICVEVLVILTKN